MSSRPPLTDRDTLALARHHAQRQGADLFFFEYLREEVKDRLSLINREWTRCAVITGMPCYWANIFGDADFIADAPVLSFPRDNYDLILDLMNLHWAEDPVGQMIQAQKALKPDGLYMATFVGEKSLSALREAFIIADIRQAGGASPRFVPMIDIQQAGQLLQRAGYALPVVDRVPFEVLYHRFHTLLHDLRLHGEGNALAARRKSFTSRAVFEMAEAIFSQQQSREDGKLLARIDVLFLSGWRPHPDQPQPLRPGTATHALADILKQAKNTDEN